MSRRTVALVAALGAGLLAGCSDDEPAPGPGTSAPDASGPAHPSSRPSGSASPSGEPSQAPSPSSQPSPSGEPSSSGSAPGAGEALAWEEAVRRAEGLVADLPVEQLAGQVIVAGYEGTGPRGAEALVRDGFGGVIAFSANVPQDVTALAEVNAAVQRAQAESGRDWPAVIGVDQEGGPVQRLGEPVTQFPAGMAHGAADDADLSREVARHSGEQLRALGFTMVFAPDADVTVGPQDPTIGVRSPGSDPQRVAQVAGALVQGYRQAGIVPVAKHFPGHGGLTTDSHEGLPATDASVEELGAHDLVPFSALAEHDVPVMVGHIAVTALDDLPATLSARTTGLLRDAAGPDVLVVTDALNMGALDAAEESTGTDRSVAALAAGSDLLLMPPDPQAARAAVVEAVAEGALPEERLRDAASHVVAASLQVGAESPGAVSDGGVSDGGVPASGAGRALADRLAAAALTSLGETCDPAVLSAGDVVRVVGGTEEQRGALGEALDAAGLSVSAQGDTVLRIVDGGDYAAGQVEDGQMPGDTSSGPQGGGAPRAADVALSLDVPYGLEGVDAPVELAAFGDTAAHLRAVAGALVGEVTPAGTLPVPLGDRQVGSACD
ncbi:glycoside hydrolase family 3 N-terminal domain-containing protein [Kytococcus sedentarius]|uniref:glycoside hydrolase family 3 N-terminal domain-containing protein n=1 Tax=Kytococcus sedentarius TaxID=1276 RepID=UPI0035BC580F